MQPILSPDGAHVAYFQAGDLKRVAVTSRVPSTVCACGDARGATWGEDGYNPVRARHAVSHRSPRRDLARPGGRHRSSSSKARPVRRFCDRT
ncbi:MAG TPA: hypothetical protein VFO14_22510 [Vicinamibacterales bacterium]|nr:hypothetical protein [Vicinamibacterales bacterium]